MIDKLSIIKQILETDVETDKKILSVLQLAKEKPATENIYNIEERVAKRKNITIEIDLNIGKERIQAKTENISSTGAFIQTKKKIAQDEDIAISLTGPSGDEFSFIAKVMRVNDRGIGVMIKAISKKNETKFTEFLDQF